MRATQLKCTGLALMLTVGVSACAEDTLQGGGWNRLAFMLDQPPGRRAQTPDLELGSMVYGKIVQGGVSIRSSDPDVFEVVGVDERVVGVVCDPHCVDDLDTWFTLRANGVGSAALTVVGEGGDRRDLPIEVSEAVTIEVQRLDIEEAVEVVTIVIQPVILDLILRDSEGTMLVTHALWTLDDAAVAEFPRQDPPPTTNLFIQTTPTTSEGPLAGLAGIEGGTTTLRAESSAGMTISLPVEVTR